MAKQDLPVSSRLAFRQNTKAYLLLSARSSQMDARSMAAYTLSSRVRAKQVSSNAVRGFRRAQMRSVSRTSENAFAFGRSLFSSAS